MYCRRFFLISILFFIMSLGFASTALANQAVMADEEPVMEYYAKAEVLEIHEFEKDDQADVIQEQLVTVRVLEGKYKDKILDVTNALTGSKGMDLIVKQGDQVVVYLTENGKISGENEEIEEAYLAEKVRSGAYRNLGFIFIGLLVLIGGIQGIKALVGLGFTAMGIIWILLPKLSEGYSPLLITIPVLLVVTLLTMIVVGGFSRKTVAATAGTMGGLLIAGLMATLVGDQASLCGLGTEEERMLLYVETAVIDTKGLLFAGILIGALGAIMDVAMSVASAIEEVKKANPELSPWSLTRAGMQVGRDIMGTMANTLILAYVGGTLPFLLLYVTYQTPALFVLNTEFVASEIVRALAGSIGLIIAVPITALIAGALSQKTPVRRNKETARSISLPLGDK